ncbi:MAG: S9 family peptidase [Bacteroidales bacterium]|nr:S9 family peptidase [Bacteroidales bacterium]
MKFFKILLLSVTALLVCQVTAFSQSNKMPLDHSVYEGWKSIRNPRISNNGMWATYEVNPGKGDGWLYLVNLEDNSLDSVPRGYDATFSYGTDFLVCKVKVPFQTERQAKKDKLKKAEMPKDSLAIRILDTGELLKFHDVQSYKVPADGSQWMAFQYHEIEDTTNKEEEVADTLDTEKKEKERGSDLVVMNPITQASYTFNNVTEYQAAKQGTAFGFVQESSDTIPVSTVTFFPALDQEYVSIFEGTGKVPNLILDESGQQLAYLYHPDTAKEVGFDLYIFNAAKEKAEKIIDTLSEGMPLEWGISKHYKTWFSGDGSRLYFGTAPKLVKEPEDTLLDDEKYSVDVWNWKDPLLQPQQKVELKDEKNRTCQAVYHVNTSKMVQLADEEIRSIRTGFKGGGKWALGISRKPYEKLSSWEAVRYQDGYSINMETGEREMLVKKKSYTMTLSPNTRYLIWYEILDSNWYAHDIEEGSLSCLTCDIPVNFYNEIFDMPYSPDPYGYAGGSADDRYIYIYDRYDIWKIDVTSKNVPINLTNGSGRENKIQFRYMRTNYDINYIPAKEPMYLSARSEKTKETGRFKTSAIISMDPEKLLFGGFSLGNFSRARNADRFIYSKGSFTIYPDLYVTDGKFDSETRISNAVPEMTQYLWGDARLVNWTSFDNEKLDGILYTPENLDPGKKYPMLVYFYEKSSSGLYYHRIPSPSASTINIPYCVSNGYVVFVPDINYKTGYPGQSCYNAVVSGTMAMVNEFDFIDKDHMGIQGQSWGGYQVAYLVTETNLYAAAMAGAPVSNMTSAYGGIRWGSGKSRMFQYEESQSRIGGTLWEKTSLYLGNSPLFHVPKIKTPVLIMHNDNDGAVPWYQGIEFFVALRRLNKPSWLLVYNNEEHNLTKWPNRVDLSIRMMQFFDHYLKGAPAPEWMEEGLPAIDKGKKDGYGEVDSRQ